jgi:hypothetical protein
MIDIQVDSPGNKFRAARVRLLKALITKTLSEKSSCSILDIGGTHNFWHVWRNEIDWTRTQITCVNLNPSHLQEGKDETRVKMLKGNACDLVEIGDNEYDIAFSNSVIEHVGRWNNMRQMANEVKRVAPRYMIQTPNFWFPIEPHARTPFLHWLPEPVAYRIVMARKCGFWQKHETVSGAVETVQSAKLIDFRQIKELFNDAQIVREKFFGLTKSLIAIRD